MLHLMSAAVAVAQSPASLSDTEWVSFLEDYPSMSADAVFVGLTRLGPDHVQQLQVYTAVAFDMHLMACQGNYGGAITYGGGCANINAQYRQTIAMTQSMGGALGNPRGEAELQRGNMLIAARCSDGTYDAGSCQAYVGHQGAFNQSLAQTGDAIVAGFAPAPCTEYFDGYSGVFLGCW